MAFNRPLEAAFQYITGIQDLEDPIEAKDNNGSKLCLLPEFRCEREKSKSQTERFSIPDLLHRELRAFRRYPGLGRKTCRLSIEAVLYRLRNYT